MSSIFKMLDFRFYLCYNANAFLETLLPGGGVKQNNRNPLQLNVGFLLHQSVGFSRKFEFDEPTVQIDDDLDVKHLQGSLRFTRTAQGLYAEGELRGSVPLECVSCLSEYQRELKIEPKDLFIYPASKALDPLLAIPETGFVDLTGFIRELLVLEIPIQPTCSPECQGLCPICGNKRSESDCQHPEVEIDPRLAILQSLLPDT